MLNCEKVENLDNINFNYKKGPYSVKLLLKSDPVSPHSFDLECGCTRGAF